MSIERMMMENAEAARSLSGASSLRLELIRVDRVDSEKMLLDVFRLESAKALSNVPFGTPARFLDRGILVMPEEGALGVMATTKDQHYFVITFLSFADSEDIGEHISDGEIVLQPKGYGFIKLDNSGNVVISSSNGSYTMHTKDGQWTTALTSRTKSAARDIISGIVDGIVQDIEKYYDKDVSCLLSTKDMVNKILNNEQVDLVKPTPILTIQRGNALDESGEKIKLELYEASDDNPEVCYLLNVMGEGGLSKCSIMIAKDGSAKITGNKLILDFNELDMTKIKIFNPDTTKYDAYEDTYEYKNQ